MADRLFERLKNELSALSQDQYRLIGQDLFQALETMLGNFEHVPRISLPLTDVPSRPINSKMDHWLIQQALPQSKTEAAHVDHPYLEATTHRPFMTFRMGARRRLTNVESYWFEGGSTRALFNNVPPADSRLEEARLQLTLYAPYLLLCNGVLRGGEWWKAIAQTIRANATYGTLKPVVIILADAVDEQTEFPDDTFYTIVLPAPRDAEIHKGSFIPDRPQLEAMARAFGTHVAPLWVAPPSSPNPADSQEPDWTGLARHLARARGAARPLARDCGAAA